MALNDVIVHMDNAGAAGVDITAADFIGGGDVPIVMQGEVPTLMCIDSATYDEWGSTGFNGLDTPRWQLLPPTWPSTEQLGDRIDYWAGSSTVLTEGFSAGKREMIVAQDVNMAHKQRFIGPNTTWINAGQSLIDTPLTTDAVLVLHNQYKQPGVFPYRGGPIIHITKPIAAAVMTTADAWDEVFNEVLTDDTPALDPDKMYRLHAITATGLATTMTDWIMGVRFSVVGADQYHAVGIGGGYNPADLPPKTVFLEDSIPPFQGNRTVVCEVLASAAMTDTATVDLWLEEYGSGAGVSGGIGAATGGLVEDFTEEEPEALDLGGLFSGFLGGGEGGGASGLVRNLMRG